MIKLKKLFAALLVPALSATVFAGIASADYSYDAATGTRTWTFYTPATETYLNDTAKTTTYYLYSDTLSDCYGTDDAAKAKAETAQTDKDLLISSYVGNSTNANTIGAGSLYGTYEKALNISFTAPFDGTISVTYTVDKNGTAKVTINGTEQDTAQVKSGENVNITYTGKKCRFSQITFTPSTSTETFDVESITIGDDTKYAGVIFTAEGYDDWDCSIWDKVQNFRGNVDFKVQMTNVPTNVEVSAQSYAN